MLAILTCGVPSASRVTRSIAGAAGVLCQAPMDIIEDKEQVKAFMHELAELDLPMLMIQDLHWNGYGMGLDTIRELWEEIDSFRCASSWRPCTQGTR